MPLAYGLTEPVDLSLSRLPHAIERLRIAHLTDLHLVKPSRRMEQLITHLTRVRIDLGVLTGDYMLKHLNHDAAVKYLRELTRAVRPRLGWFGVYGNHDMPRLIEALDELPVTWLSDEAVALSDKPIEIVGLRCNTLSISPDPVKLAQAVATLPTDHSQRDQRLRLVLSHRPDFLPLASELGGDLMLSGHTHGGQIRLPPHFAVYNSSGLPLHMSAGLLRHRDTLAVISRGLGSTDLFNSPLRPRLFCPPHAPIYTLHRNTMPGEHVGDILPIWRW